MSQIPGEKETEEDVLRFVSKDALLTVQLPLARQEAEAKRAKEDFDDLRKYVKAGEFKEAWNLFNELKENDVLGKEMLIKLFPEVSANPPLADAVLQLVINDYQTWLLASSHPELRRFAWAVGAPKMSDEAALVEITSFPKSDVSKEAVEDSIRHYWEERVIKRANSLEGSTGFLLYIIDILIESVEEFRADGYPVRAEAYTETILRLADEFDYKIDNETAYRIMQLVREQKVRIFDEGGSIEEKKEIEEEKEAVELTPDEVKSKAYEILRDAGALFTVKTEINPVSSTTAEVSGIIFFDQERVFELDVVNSEVSQIVHEGRVMPFSLPISAYVSWASK